MAQTAARMDEFELYAATAETVGVPYEWLSPAQIRDRWPLVRAGDLKGALFHPTDGYINPADVTQAMAKGARQFGCEIHRKAQIDGLRWTGSEWIVSGRIMTERGGNLVPSDEVFEMAQGERRAPGAARRRREMVRPRGARRLDPRPLRNRRPGAVRIRRARQLGRDATPLEDGIDRFVDVSKDFHGKAAMEATGERSLCVTLLVDGPDDADPWGREALHFDGATVGRLTSGGGSEAFGKSIGMGFVRPDLATPGTRLEVRMQGRLWSATVTEDCPYDPTNARIRADG